MLVSTLLFLTTAASALTIISHPSAASSTRLGASELRRYLYDARIVSARPSFASSLPPKSSEDAVVICTVDEAPQLLGAITRDVASPPSTGGYSIAAPRAGLVAIVGSDAQHALYGAYSYLERRGLTFTSAGVTLPAPGASTQLPPGFSTVDSPVFTTRGLQPFHDFTEGPDWWGEDETKRVIESILSMKGNIIGFHTYPLIEPAVWVGLAEDVVAGGNVSATPFTYSTRWATTLEEEGSWGYNPVNTSSFGFGATQIFEHECFGHETVSGNAALCPSPKTPEDSAELFNRVGLYWKKTFAHATALGVQTVLGTEIPLSIPPSSSPSPTPPPAPLATLPLQVWYSSKRNDHFVTTTDCAECDDLYVFVGVTGWVYANNVSGSTPLCTYARGLPNGQIDNELTVCDSPGFVRIEGYAPASGTSGTEALTQFISAASGHHWAANAEWSANATAAGFAASGLIAQVFATGPPPPSPQNQNATIWYEGIFTRLEALLGANLTYYWGWTPEGWEWDKVSIDDPKIQLAVADTRQMQSAWDAVQPSFKLASCGWTVGPLGARWYYDTVLPPSWTISSIDMDVGNTPIDPAYANITHRVEANKWAIPWAEDDPGLTAPELWVNRSLSHARDANAYGVGGLLSIHWRTRMTSPQIGSAHAVAWNISLDTQDYWRSWAAGQFGDAAVASTAAAIFGASADSYDLPRPVSWIGGPGGFSPGCAPAGTYDFVDSIVALRPALLASIAAGRATLAHLENFDYWAGQFVYMRSISVFTCDWAAYNGVISSIQKISDPAARQAAAIAQGLPARVSLMANFSTVVYELLSTASGIEQSGTLYDVLSHSSWSAVGPAPTRTLEGLTGSPLPSNALPPPSWPTTRAPIGRVQTIRTMLAAGEPLRIRSFLLSPVNVPPTNATLFWALAGSAAWTPVPLTQAAPEAGIPRFVFTASIDSPTADFEWFVRFDLPANTTAYTDGLGIPAGTVISPSGIACFVPPGGPSAPQSVIIVPQ